MRGLESIDDELALTAEVRQALLDEGCSFPTWQVDDLLDERLRFVSARALLGRAHLALRWFSSR